MIGHTHQSTWRETTNCDRSYFSLRMYVRISKIRCAKKIYTVISVPKIPTKPKIFRKILPSILNAPIKREMKDMIKLFVSTLNTSLESFVIIINIVIQN